MFKISDEDIMSFVKKSYKKEAKEAGLLEEEVEGGKIKIDSGCEGIPVYPTLNLNKLIGKKQPSDVDARQFRGMLERVGISVVGGDVKSRIQSLNNIIVNTLETDMKGVALDQMVSRFVFLDSFLALLDRASYEPQMAGLLLEPLIAAVLKGEQKGGTQVIADFEVTGEDIDTGVSLKLKGDNIVKGSMILFIKGLLIHGEIGFYHVRKLSQPKSNIVNAVDMFYHNIERPPKLFEYLVEQIKYLRTRDMKKAVDVAQDNTDEVKRIIAEIDKLMISPEALANSLYFDPNGVYKREIEEIVAKKFFSDISKKEGGTTAVHFSVLGIEGTHVGNIKLPTVNELRVRAATTINKLNDDVADLYKNIGLLSCIMKNYTSSSGIGRDAFAEKASEYAVEIQNTAEEISSPKQE